MEAKIKHLEFIQNIITRMTSNSFLLKGWCLTIIGGIFALNNNDTIVSLYPRVLPSLVLMFWLLDSYYLLQERLFIALYNNVIKKPEDEINFTMHTKEFCKGKNTWFSSFFSRTMMIFYGFFIIAIYIITT